MAASELLRRRLGAQGLSGPPIELPGPDGAVAVAQRLLAIQGQDPRGARLSVRARSRRVTGADVDAALGERRELVLTWLGRGTLHLVATADYPLLQTLTTPSQRTANARRLAQEEVKPAVAERAVALVDATLGEEGPRTSAQLRATLRSAGLIGDRPQALVHVLLAAALEGRIVRGPVTATGEQAYVRLADWLPDLPDEVARVSADRDRALGELARRYLIGHGPAEDRDLARWAGLPLRDARAGLRRIASQLHTRDDGLIQLRAAAADLPAAPRPRLLGAFEPLLMGWRSRALVLGPHEAEVVTGGIFRGFALVGGRAAGVWRFAARGVAFEPFEKLSEAQTRALERDGADVMRFLRRERPGAVGR